MPAPIVTFLSDFGLEDWFVGVVHGVVNEIAPETHVVDLNHLVPPGHIARGAFVLEAAAPDFAPGTVHLAVVDPGVGTARRAIAVDARGQRFVGPDNGLLEWALSADDAVVHELSEPRYFRAPLSRTFHGRDLFGPVAAHLARGVPLASFGPRITDPVRLPASPLVVEPGRVTGRVVFIDRFGNALTNITAGSIAQALGGSFAPDELKLELLDREVTGLSRSYGDSPVGTLVAIMGSSGRIEVSQVGGDAAVRLGIGEGDPVTVRRAARAGA